MNSIFTWLQVSDIHFGHGDASAGWDQRLVVSELTSDIVNAITTVYPPPDVVLLTGDVAFSGGSRRPPGRSAPLGEYHEAKDWLSELLRKLALPLERAFVVPGNHDVQRDVAAADRNVHRLLDDLRNARDKIDTVWSYPDDEALLIRCQANYLEFASSFGTRTQHPYWMERLATTGDVTVRLVGLNSALLCAGDDDHKKLELGNEQLVRTLLRPPVQPNELVVVLTHHPFDWLRDEAGVLQTVQRHAHVHLCGHVHQAESTRILSGGGAEFVRIVAGAVHDFATPGSAPLRFGYNFGSIHPEADGSLALRVWPRAWSPANRDFRTDLDNVPDGKRYASYGLRFRGGFPSASAPNRPSTQTQAPAQAGLAGATQIADPVERVRFLRQLADDFAHRREAQTAGAVIVAALEIASMIPDTRIRAMEMTDLALALARVGQTDRARLIVSDASTAIREITDPMLKATVAHEIVTSVTRLESLASEQRGPASALAPMTTASSSTDGSITFGKAPSGALVRRVRIFVSSPGDVSVERAQVHDVVSELNRTLAPSLGLILELVGWETHVHPAMGRPQEVINGQIADIDIFLGIMSRRFGTPTGIAGSGTEEEFQVAYQRWHETGRPHILFYFSDEPFSFPQSDEELAQVAKVHAFRKEMRNNALVMHYTSPREFSNVIRPPLALLLQRHFASTVGKIPETLRKVSKGANQQLRDLAKEYELIRELMKPSEARTIRMETVVTRMRALAAEIRPLLPELKMSQSPGERLAALAILQVFPECTELEWLLDRFARQPGSDYQIEKPFIGYHAAEALREAARRLQNRCGPDLRRCIEAAVRLVSDVSSDRAYVLRDALKNLDRTLDRRSEASSP